MMMMKFYQHAEDQHKVTYRQQGRKREGLDLYATEVCTILLLVLQFVIQVIIKQSTLL